MSIDNRPTDGESDSHTVRFGSVEGFEDPVRGLRRQTDSRISHA